MTELTSEELEGIEVAGELREGAEAAEVPREGAEAAVKTCGSAEASGKLLEDAKASGGPCDGAEAAEEIADVGLGAGLSLRHTEVVLGLVEHRVVLLGRLNVALWTLQWGLDP